MPIRVFPPHYQLVYINFDISFFSLISYKAKGPRLHRNRGPFASPTGPFQARFRDKTRVNKIQTADCQPLKSAAKIAPMRPNGLPVANSASREAENGQIV